MARAAHAAAGLALLALVAAPFFGEEEERPKKIGLVERAGTRLAQIDVTVIGPAEAIEALTDEDFKVKVNLTRLKQFRVDRLCGPLSSATGADALPSAAPSRGSTPTYLLYFDQPHLTLPGRQNALDLARKLVARLIVDGTRGMIVSNASKLAIIEPLTADAGRLLEALDRLEQDRTQWDTYAQLEQSRVSEVIRVMNDENLLSQSVGLARRYHQEESFLTDRNMRRLKLTLGQLVDLDPPKALIYFGDNLRSNPGEHYLSFFGRSLLAQHPVLGVMATGSRMGGLAFDDVVNEASAQGIRIYSIQAEGLVQQTDSVLLNPNALSLTGTVSAPSRVREQHARSTLASLAMETGGEAFFHGASAGSIAGRIESDSGCLFLISFDPEGLPLDTPLRTVVKVERPDVKLRVRGRLVVQSDSSRLISSLLRAFGSPDSIPDPFDLHTGLIPTGFKKGAYSALLQLRVPGTPLQGASWEMGATVVAGEKVSDEASGRLTVSGPGVPVVFERELSFKPGDYEITSVAHEQTSGLIASNKLTVVWPDPDDKTTTIGPIALLQPVDAAFMRDGQSRTSGSMVRGPGDAVVSDRPTALVGLVCRGRKQQGTLGVLRSLVGDTVVDFPPLSFDLEEERCAQVRDLVPAGGLPAGAYRYLVRVFSGSRQLGEGGREFVVVAP